MALSKKSMFKTIYFLFMFVVERECLTVQTLFLIRCCFDFAKRLRLSSQGKTGQTDRRQTERQIDRQIDRHTPPFRYLTRLRFWDGWRHRISLPLPHSLDLFALAPLLERPELLAPYFSSDPIAEKLFRAAQLESFGSYGNACYVGYDCSGLDSGELFPKILLIF